MIQIQNQKILLKEYKGKRVVTFRDIDMVHERSEGTAKRNFMENKEHFIEGEDYFNITVSQKNEFRTLEIPNRGIIVLTESGYLMLVKSLNDDLAWRVQRELINCYFNYKEVVKRLKPIDRALKQHMNIAQTLIQTSGVKDGIAYAVAIEEASKETGYDYEAYKKLLPNATHDIGDMNATKLGKNLGKTAKETNLLLQKMGLQEKKGKDWRLTDKGKQYAEEMPFTKFGHTGYQILWHKRIINKIKNGD